MNEGHKIIFLDFDGVLNSRDYFIFRHYIWKIKKFFGADNLAHYRRSHELSRIYVRRLNKIIKKTDAYIVVSSVWRLGHTIEELREILVEKGFKYPEKLISKTGRSNDGIRGGEIQEWLDEYFPQSENFIILDDDSDMLHLMPHLVKTQFETGLTRKKMKECINRLNQIQRRGLLW